jgi:hypothetical protein
MTSIRYIYAYTTFIGRVTFKLTKPLPSKEMKVALLGIAENATHRSVGLTGTVFLHRQVTLHAALADNETATVSSANTSTSLDTSSVRQASVGPQYADENQSVLAAGTHVWTFSVSLPINMHLPNSMDSQRNKIYYKLRALHRSTEDGSGDVSAEADVRVRDPIHIDTEPYSLPTVLHRPFQTSKAVSWLTRSASAATFAPFKALMRTSSSSSLNSNRSSDNSTHTTDDGNTPNHRNDMYATLSLARTGYRAGERLRMMITLTNSRSTNPVGVKAQLRRIAVYRNESLTDVEDVVVAGGQRPLDDPSGVFELQLPRRMLSTSNAPGSLLNGMDGASCLTIRYMLEVTLRYPTSAPLLPRPTAKFRVPVVIGVFSNTDNNARNRRWAAWWRSVALNNDPAAAHAYASALAAGATGDGPSFADWEFAEEIMSITHDGGLLPAYEPPPPSYDQVSCMPPTEQMQQSPELDTSSYQDSMENSMTSTFSDNTMVEACDEEHHDGDDDDDDMRAWRPISLPPPYAPNDVAFTPLTAQ